VVKYIQETEDSLARTPGDGLNSERGM